MKSSKTAIKSLVRLLVVTIVLVLSCAGCGQKGPLKQPETAFPFDSDSH